MITFTVPTEVVTQFFGWMRENNVTYVRKEFNITTFDTDYDICYRYSESLIGFIFQAQDEGVIAFLYFTFTFKPHQPAVYVADKILTIESEYFRR